MTFLGAASAAAGVSKAAPAAAATNVPGAGYGRSPNIIPARIPSTPPPMALPAMPSLRPQPPTASSAPSAAPPRNLPRGSLLDLSV